MRLTARGRTLVLLAVVFLVIGRVFALRELTMLGAASGVALTISGVAIWLRRGTVSVARSIQPASVKAGTNVRVEMSLTAESRLGTAPFLVTERIPPVLGEDIRLTVDPGGNSRKVAYSFAPGLRGRYELGPLQIVDADPFGAMTRVRSVKGVGLLTVLPAYDVINTMPSGVQRLGAIRHSPRLGQGDEFYGLRPYERGDDLRKIHWPSSAKIGHPLIRQEEMLGEPRVIVILDTCADKHRGTGKNASIEAAVSACASISILALRQRMRLRIATPEGALIPSHRTTEREVLEALAIVDVSRSKSITPAFEHLLLAGTAASAVVVISPGMSDAELGALARIVHLSVGGAIVHVIASSFGGGPKRRTVASVSPVGLPVVPLQSGDSFQSVWESGLRRRVSRAR